MIAAVIKSSVENRFVVVLLAIMLTGWGVYALQRTPIDAIPDLSDVQVIVKTTYPGQAPQVVEDQVSYPLTTAMLAVPKAVSVRGYSFFGDSYVYVIFEDGTDLYWARARILEYLNQAAAKLPAEAKPVIGPDATGVGWIYQYALVDRTGTYDLAQLRSLQDWFLKFELQTVPGVSEVASIGGMVRQYQVVVDPNSLRAHGLHLSAVKAAIERGNQEVGGSVVEMAEAEYMVRSSGYVADQVELPPQYSISWSGQYEYIERAKQRLTIVIPAVFAVILVLLFLNFRNVAEVAMVVLTAPLALVGGVWLLYLLDYDLSVAVGVGFIALAGVAVETGVLMLTYLDRAFQQQQELADQEGRALTAQDVIDSVRDGAVLRVRPIMMTVSTIIVGLITVMLGEGTGSEVMSRIAAPMVGGMVTALILTLMVLPAVYALWKRRTVH